MGFGKAFLINIIREIKGSLGRFIAIIAIVALGSGFLVGILSTTPDMKYSVDAYYKATNMTDIFIKATMGLTERDIEAIRSIDGVRAVMPAYVTDILMETEEEEVLAARIYGLPVSDSDTGELINELTLTEGRMPAGADECVVQKPVGGLTAPAVGSRIRISPDNEDYEKIGDTYAETEYTVTGVVENPFYFSNEKEQSTVGNGKLDMVIYTPEDSYALEVYTDFYLILEGSRRLQAFTDEYEDYVEGIVNQIETVSGVQVRLRYEEIRGEADDELKDATEEYLEEKEKAERELADARGELDDGWDELNEGRKELREGESQVNSHEKDVEEAEQKLADGKTRLDEAYNTLYAKEAEIFTAEQTLAQGQARLDDGWSQFREGENKFAEAKELLTDQETELAKQEELLLASEQQLLASGATRESMEQVKAAMQQFRAALQPAGQSWTAYMGELGLQMEEAVNAETMTVAEPGNTGQSEAGLEPGNTVQPGEGSEQENAGQSGDTDNPGSTEPETTPTVDPALYEKTMRAMGVAGQWIGSGLAAIVENNPEGRQLLQDIASLQPPDTLISEEQWQGFIGLIDGCEAGADTFLEAYEQIQTGKTQIEDGKRQINEAWDIMDQQRDELERVRKTLQVRQDELDAASNQLADGRVKLEDGWAEYRRSEAEYQDGEAELADGRRQLADARAKLADARRETADGEAKLQDGEKEYSDARKEAEDSFSEAEAELADARKEIDEIEQPEWYVLDRGSNATYVSYRMNVEKVADVAKLFPLFFFLVSTLVSLTTMTRMVEEERSQIGTLKALGYRSGVIMSKYLIYCGVATVIGCALGLACGFKLLPTVINQAYQSIYDLPPLITRINWVFAGFSCLLQLLCTLAATFSACRKALKEKPAMLLMPKAPKAGHRIFLEYLKPLWRHLSFSRKATARNLFRYKKHLLMTVTGIAGCTALILVGFGMRDSMEDVAGTQFTDILRYDMKISLGTEKETDPVLEDFLEGHPYLRAYGETMKASDMEGEESYTVTLAVPEDPDSLGEFVKLYDRKEEQALHFTDNSVVLTEKLAELLGVEQGGEFWLEDSGKTRHAFTVSGITENYTGGYVYMGAAAYAGAFPDKEANTIYVKSGITQTVQQEETSEALLGGELVAGVEFTSQTKSTYETLLGSMSFVIAVLILCAGGLAVIVLYNLTNININERIRELATLRVLGYHHREVAQYIFREINLLSLMGIGVGLILGVLLHRYVIVTAESLEMMFGHHIKVMSYVWAASATLLFTFLVDGLMSVKLRRIKMAESLKTVE